MSQKAYDEHLYCDPIRVPSKSCDVVLNPLQSKQLSAIGQFCLFSALQLENWDVAISNLVHESNVSTNFIVRKAEEAKRTHSVLQGDEHLSDSTSGEVWSLKVSLPCHAPGVSLDQPQCILPAWKSHRECTPFGENNWLPELYYRFEYNRYSFIGWIH